MSLLIRDLTVALFLSVPALDDMVDDITGAMSNLALQSFYFLHALQSERYSICQRLQDQFHRHDLV